MVNCYRHQASSGLSEALSAQDLFDGGSREAAIAQTQAAYDASVASYRQIVLAAFQEVEDNLAALNILGQRLTATVLLVKALGGSWNKDFPAS